LLSLHSHPTDVQFQQCVCTNVAVCLSVSVGHPDIQRQLPNNPLVFLRFPPKRYPQIFTDALFKLDICLVGSKRQHVIQNWVPCQVGLFGQISRLPKSFSKHFQTLARTLPFHPPTSLLIFATWTSLTNRIRSRTREGIPSLTA
jgi:hypothetical protein